MQALETFELELKNILKGLDCAYLKEISEFIFAPSKRLRPRLIFSTCKALGKPIEEKHIKLAVAIELLHSATLVHDDIIDSATLRRGKDSFFAKLGSHGAVLIGDYILALVLKILAELNLSCVTELYSKYIMRVISGEFKQMQNKGGVPDEEEYIEICAKKTASLFELAINSAFQDVPDDVRLALLDYAKNFGIAFQIKNDIVDFENNNLDLKNGTYTFPNILKEKGFSNSEIKVQCEGRIASYAELAKSAIRDLTINKEYLTEFLGYLK
ncbi:polyprenyl synthetase family protein [bacterium]|nr:polyprenyl synthetase family protein [bacterium]